MKFWSKQQMNFQNNIPKYLFGYGLCIFPLFLLIGPLISEIFLISIIFFSFYYIFKLNKSYFYLNRYTFFFIIFYLSVLISTLLNFYNFDYAISGIMYFRLPLFALASWFVFENYKLFSKKIVIFYIFFFSFIIIDSLIQYITGENILGYSILKSRISSFFG